MRFHMFYVSSLLIIIVFFITQSEQSDDGPDTSLLDWVAYHILEEYVDILEMTAWFGRKVKDHIDELLEESFVFLTKQQEMLQPALQLAEEYNKPECNEGKMVNVTDAVFAQYFNMNINCPSIGQKMAIFFNEIHNITMRITDIHRRHINLAPSCGPPHIPRVERTCLQNIIDQCRRETSVLKNHMSNLNFDVEEFMDGQIEEAFECSIKAMSHVRNVTKQAVQDIYCCLDLDGSYNINKKYESPLVLEAMGQVKKVFQNMNDRISEAKKQSELQPGFGQPQGIGNQYHPQGPPPHQPQFYGQPPQGMQPQFVQQPGMQQQFVQQPGMQPQFVQQPGMHPQFVQQQGAPQNWHPGMEPEQDAAGQQQQYGQYGMRPRNPLEQQASPPPWRTNPENLPNIARNDNMFGSFEFDPGMFENNEKQFGNIFGEQVSKVKNYNRQEIPRTVYKAEPQKNPLKNYDYHSSL